MISLQLTVSCRTNTVILRAPHLSVVRQTQGTLIGDAVVRRQRAESLELTEEAVAHILQGAFPSPVNTHYPQLLIVACQVILGADAFSVALT